MYLASIGQMHVVLADGREVCQEDFRVADDASRAGSLPQGNSFQLWCATQELRERHAAWRTREQRRNYRFQRSAAAWSLSRPSTQRGPSLVFSFFQNGARVFR